MAWSFCVLSAILLVFSVGTFSHAFSSQNVVPRQISAAARHSWTCYATKEGWEDEHDDEVSYRTRYTRESDAARELQNLRYERDDETLDIVKDDYYDEDDDLEYEEEDVYIDEEEEDEPTGNFWFNPKQGFDPLPSERQRTSRIEEATDKHPIRRPRPRSSGSPKSKTTFRSGEPKTPEPVADLYDRLFWYGFNPDESIAPGDKTLFGGTKGKFNGLNFFEDDEKRRKPEKARRRKRPPQAFRADEWYDDIMDSLDSEYSTEEVEVSASERRVPRSDSDFSKRRSLPPEETEYSYEDEGDYPDDDVAEEVEEKVKVVGTESVTRQPRPEVKSPRRRRPQPPPEDFYYEEERFERRRPRDAGTSRGTRRPSAKRPRSGDRISNQVSSWFGPGDTDDYESEWSDDYDRRRPRRRPIEDDDGSWSFTGILDGIFGVNREEVDMNAAMYNRQMGLEKSNRPQRRSSRRRRPGQAYPFVEDREEAVPAATYEEDLELADVVDVDAVIEDEEDSREAKRKPKRKRERTIEERSAAFERVPPSGVPAWGPSGEVGVDARTKATLDALEDIREATRKVELKEEECIEAKEDIVVMKADFELQKKRLLASIDDPSRVRSRLRQMKMGVEDAARSLRRAKAELEVARERLADLEDRNWALLSLYDADKAFQEVVETFREFEESERLETRLKVGDSKIVGGDSSSRETNGVKEDDDSKIESSETVESRVADNTIPDSESN